MAKKFNALMRLGVPTTFTSQLFFLYRYIFVLIEEAMWMVRAREIRSFGSRGTGIKVFIHLIGVLLIRTIERAERIYNAMLSRCFRGHISSVREVNHEKETKELTKILSPIIFKS